MMKQDDGVNGMLQGLNSIEKDTIGEILNISMGAGATAISTLLGRKVNITTPTVNVVNRVDMEIQNLEPAIGIEIGYLNGLSGSNYLVMKRKDVKSIVGLLIPGMEEMDDEELDEMHVSAISEIMNQMMGASCTALASFFGKDIDISIPKQFDLQEFEKKFVNDATHESIVSVKFTLDVEDLLNSEFITVMPMTFTKELISNAMNFGDTQEEEVLPIPSKPEPIPMKSKPIIREEPKPAPPQRHEEPKSKVTQNNQVSIKPLKLESFDEDYPSSAGENKGNFSLIMGVPLEVSVEIGRTKMIVRNVLDIRQGTIVELDKQAGDPVDIMVNGQLIAKGDVVIIDDNFGVRITEILSNKEIMDGLD